MSGVLVIDEAVMRSRLTSSQVSQHRIICSSTFTAANQ